jgi:putative ABC transport system permease protein
MRWFPSFRQWLPRPSRRRREEDIDRELRSHLDLETEERRAAGLTPEDAHYAAERAFGNVTLAKEDIRSTWKWAFREQLWQDSRYAARVLRKSPGFTGVAVLSIGLGIGASTAIFSVCNAVLLKPLRYSEPDRLVMLWEKDRRNGILGPVAPANFVDWRTRSHAFSEIAALNPFPNFTLTGQGEPERLTGGAVSSNFFALFGTRITLGREFLAEEDRSGHGQVAILSHELWQRRFGSRPNVIGEPMVLNNVHYTIVGVLPPGFQFVSKSSDFQGRNQFDLWVPLGLKFEKLQRGTHPLRVFARLRPGVSFDQAQAELAVISSHLERAYPESNKNRTTEAVPLAEQVTGNSRRPLFTVLAAVGLLLLISCANVASLLLSRAAARQKEIALRVALGASRFRIGQQLLIESLLLAVLGGLVGLTVSWLAMRTLTSFLPADLPRIQEIAMDGRVLAFTALVALVTGILFGLIPARQAQRTSANDSLKDSGRSTANSGQSRIRSAFVIVETAMAVMLLVGAGLMARSLWRLLDVAPGFQTDHILTFRLSLPESRYGDPRRIAAMGETLIEQLGSLPGTRSVSVTAYLPFSGTDNSWSFVIEGRPHRAPGDFLSAKYRPISRGYFETMGIPLHEGRTFTAADNADAPPVVMINESMARTYWNGESAIGKRMQFEDAPWRTIVGVVGDVRHEGLDAASKPEFYVPFAQVPYPDGEITVILGSTTEPLAILSAVRREIARLDSELPVSHVETMQHLVAVSTGQPRFRTFLLASFALIALLMAALGIYGVISYLVAQRTRELGIRLALGAQPTKLLLMVLGRALMLVSTGLALGLVGSAIAAKFIASLLYGIGPSDAATLVGVSLLLTTVALLAGYLPARRASRVDPMVALRYE